MYDPLTLSCYDESDRPKIFIKCPNCHVSAIYQGGIACCPRCKANLSLYVTQVLHISFPELTLNQVLGERVDSLYPTKEDLDGADELIATMSSEDELNRLFGERWLMGDA